ncbi:hypothetical protein [Nostoc sp.]|uniref:hypothetical protein n=1 Tax=Nostoc sp. TaxID=1180 RepID=UPI002FFB2E24
MVVDESGRGKADERDGVPARRRRSQIFALGTLYTVAYNIMEIRIFYTYTYCIFKNKLLLAVVSYSSFRVFEPHLS